MRRTAERMLRRAFGAALNDQELETLYEAATVRHFRAGEIILQQGEAGDALASSAQGVHNG